ncbi:MAG TPA: thiol reductant ABC exporter subunit CydD [Dehalococcoidia bacterium]|nr:thiol reductant ABC exporter subunit CydD [Dehalococcoidia bacterium]
MHPVLRRYAGPIRAQLAGVILLGLLATAALLGELAALSATVSRVFLAHASLAAVWPLLLALLAAALLRAALSGAQEMVARRAAIRCKSAIRVRLVAHIERLGPAFTRAEHTGELVTTATEGIGRLDAYIGGYLPQVALSVLVPLAIAAALVPVDPLSAAILLITAPVIPLLMVVVGSYAEGRARRQWEALSRLGAHFLDALQGLPTLALFGRADDEAERVARVGERYRERTMEVLRSAFLSGAVLEFLTAGAIGVLAVALGIRLLNGAISFDRAFFALLLAPEFYRPLRELGTLRHAALEGTAALERINQILDTPSPTASPAAVAASLVLVRATPPRLTLRDVRYSYPGASEPALDRVSFEIADGATTALVGRSGAGKSTLLNLLLRFVEPTSGEIEADGQPIAALSPAAWRDRVAFVPQRPHLFDGTVRDNLLLARPGATDDDLRRAAELAGADAFLAALPQGYETPLGERGARLSAGQAQRLAIARAFLKDAPLLLLDEPTSGLDPESELLIRRALVTLARERTVLVVAHRLSTVAAANRVVVLERGRVAEAGAPSALLRAGGAYSALVGAGAELTGVSA